MASVFEFTDYREFLRGRLEQGSKSGRGALARHLSVHASLLGKILKGEKQLTPDQAFQVGRFLELNALESEYFLQLVHHGRAGDPSYRESIERRLEELRREAGFAKTDEPAPLRPEQQFIYYSQWYYSAVSLLMAIDYYNGPDFTRRCSETLGLPEPVIREVLSFLTEARICTKEGDRWFLLRRNMQITGETGMVNRHLINWRMKGIERVQKPVGAGYFQTYPVALSRRSGEKAKTLLKEAYSQIAELTGKEPAEALYCLNLDWFDV